MDEYHNILSEEFPSPVREHDPLPPTGTTPPHDDEQTIHSTLEQIVEEHAADSGRHSTESHEEGGLTSSAQNGSTEEPSDTSVFHLPHPDHAPPVGDEPLGQAEHARQNDHEDLDPGASLSDAHSHEQGRGGEHDVGTSSHGEGKDATHEKMELGDPTDRRKGGVKYQTLTEKEKKERQKLQNRRAAEKSRAKKRGEL